MGCGLTPPGTAAPDPISQRAPGAICAHQSARQARAPLPPAPPTPAAIGVPNPGWGHPGRVCGWGTGWRGGRGQAECWEGMAPPLRALSAPPLPRPSSTRGKTRTQRCAGSSSPTRSCAGRWGSQWGVLVCVCGGSGGGPGGVRQHQGFRVGQTGSERCLPQLPAASTGSPVPH